ncbi:zf-HC2 domain-containing protein [bacterium]|nr:zf-HC2 domain-containing protein [bacterium]RQV98540.1 MAG: hypothetical protein EH221_01690 [bacterium]
MTCPDFENKVLLFLSGELSSSDKDNFKSHLKTCNACKKAFESIQQTWDALDRLPQEHPNPEIRKTILKQVQKAVVKTSLLTRLSIWIKKRIMPRKYVWGISTVAVTALLIFFITHPFDQKEPDQVVQTEAFEWEDDFFSQAEWINSEINRMESGQFVTTYTFMEDEPPEFQETLSPMSEDLNWIREQVENLMRTIYGI